MTDEPKPSEEPVKPKRRVFAFIGAVVLLLLSMKLFGAMWGPPPR
jgi:hypothetical protein